jgi:SPP1 gp7 family putative phage head morphogenesis protein
MPVTVEPLVSAEAVQYWKSKAPVSAKELQAMDAAARSRAFAVSGLARMDQIGAVQAAIGKAIADGETLRDFKARIGDIIEQQGWTGTKAWRVENIFRTNIQSAYMTGRYQQMQRAAKARPYWRYSAVMDRRTRPGHRALHGLVYPHDHPFWDQFYPPNGFMCRCTVTTLSARQVKARGLEVRTEIPDRIRVVDPATGMETFITPMPDKGWSTNVGQDWLAGLTPSELDGGLKDLATKAMCHRGDHADDPCKPPLASIHPRHLFKVGEGDILPPGLSDNDYLRAFLGEFGISDLHGSKAITLPGVRLPVAISRNLFVVDKKTGHPLKITKGGRERYLKLLARTILAPYEIWDVPVELSGRRYRSLRLLRLFADENGEIGGYAAFNLVHGRFWEGVTTFPAQLGKGREEMLHYLEKQRIGTLLYRDE